MSPDDEQGPMDPVSDFSPIDSEAEPIEESDPAPAAETPAAEPTPPAPAQEFDPHTHVYSVQELDQMEAFLNEAKGRAGLNKPSDPAPAVPTIEIPGALDPKAFDDDPAVQGLVGRVNDLLGVVKSQNEILQRLDVGKLAAIQSEHDSIKSVTDAVKEDRAARKAANDYYLAYNERVSPEDALVAIQRYKQWDPVTAINLAKRDANNAATTVAPPRKEMSEPPKEGRTGTRIKTGMSGIEVLNSLTAAGDR